MDFASPIWLWAMLPWLALTVWLFTGLRPRADVPFLELWRGPVRGPKPKRTLTPPPFAILCALFAALLAILAGAGPSIRSGVAPAITIIVDRGVTMSARGKTEARWRELVDDVSKRLLEQSRGGIVNVILVPGASQIGSDRASWTNILSEPSSSLRTDTLLTSAVWHALAQRAGSVLLLSDQATDVRDPRLIQFSPASKPRNVDIVAIGARQQPRPQVMVRIRNQSPLAHATLSAKSAGSTVANAVDLPPNGGERDEFIDLPSLGDVIEVNIDALDDLAADNTAWLVRSRARPSIEVRDAIPDELARMVQVYRKHRPATELSTRVMAVSDIARLGSSDIGVVIAVPAEAGRPVSGNVHVVKHPLTATVDWGNVAKDARVAARASGAGWTPLVTIGDEVLVAVRESPARQVWVGFESAQMPRTADYVVFWTNVFDWLGESEAQEFKCDRLQQLNPGWHRVAPARVSAEDSVDPQPGVYRTSDGALRAMNLLDLTFPDPPADAMELSRQVSDRKLSGAHDLTGPFAAAAALFLAFGAVASKGQKPLHADAN